MAKNAEVKTTLVCPKCKADLTSEGAVSRTYHLAKGKAVHPGHYTEEGDFEPDSRVSGGMDGAQTYDGDDRCSNCNKVVG